jgi:hypothetical protein
MVAAKRSAHAACLALILAGAPACAQDATHPAQPDTAHPPRVEAAHPAHPATEYACLDQKERRAETENGQLIRLSTAMHAAKHRMPGAVVRARLCRGHDGLVYVLTVLAHDGKVAQIAVDAAKGTLPGDR